MHKKPNGEAKPKHNRYDVVAKDAMGMIMICLHAYSEKAAAQVAERLRKEFPDLTVTITGDEYE